MPGPSPVPITYPPAIFPPTIFPKPQPWPHVPLQPWRPVDPGPNAPVGQCSACGLQLHRTMMYSCPNPKCPCGLGPTVVF